MKSLCTSERDSCMVGYESLIGAVGPPARTNLYPFARSMGMSSRKSTGFTAEERAAMKERTRELKAERGKADGEAEVLAKIAGMTKADRAMAERIHAIVKASAPELSPKTWYGMPAYARDGKVV